MGLAAFLYLLCFQGDSIRAIAISSNHHHNQPPPPRPTTLQAARPAAAEYCPENTAVTFDLVAGQKYSRADKVTTHFFR
jgi:hypothetical protein